MSRRGAVLAAVALLAGCTTTAGEAGRADAPPSSQRSPAVVTGSELASVRPHDPAGTDATDVASAGNAEVLDFTAATLDGGELRGADHVGRDVVLWMWSPW